MMASTCVRSGGGFTPISVLPVSLSGFSRLYFVEYNYNLRSCSPSLLKKRTPDRRLCCIDRGKRKRIYSTRYATSFPGSLSLLPPPPPLLPGHSERGDTWVWLTFYYECSLIFHRVSRAGNGKVLIKQYLRSILDTSGFAFTAVKRAV